MRPDRSITATHRNKIFVGQQWEVSPKSIALFSCRALTIQGRIVRTSLRHNFNSLVLSIVITRNQKHNLTSF